MNKGTGGVAARIPHFGLNIVKKQTIKLLKWF